MATTYHTALQQLYVAYFNRPADPAGLAFFEGHLEAGNTSIAAIAADFAKSVEYQTEYNQLTVSGVVTQVYQNLFGRAPDAAGLAFWVKALNDKATTVDAMVTDIVAGAQGTDKVAFDSKVVVAAAFTTALNTEAEIAAYNTPEAQDAAKALISTIKTATDATAAVVPATLDVSVAAVVKAGTPFTLESGLAALESANDTVADFLETYGEAHEIEDADADDVEAALNDARTDLVGLIDNAGFATASEGVQAALIADQIEVNAEVLVEAQKTLTAARAAVEDVDGLGEAIANLTAALEAAEEAVEAEDDAEADYVIARGVFEGRNETAAFDGETVTVEVDGEVVTVAELVGGALVVADDIDVADFNGLAALVEAANAYIAASAEAVAAADAALIEQLQVEVLENADVSTEAAFTFTLTTASTEPTVAEISDELSALAAAGDEVAYEAFRQQIEAFNAANATPLADAVVAAEKGTLGLAKAAVSAELATALEAYASAAEALEAIELAKSSADAIVVAQGDADTAATALSNEIDTFETANLGATVNANGTATYDNNGTPADLIVLVAGALEVAAGVDPATFVGLDALVAAGNVSLLAQAAVAGAIQAASDAAVSPVLLSNETVIENLATAEASLQDATVEERVAALGTEGAQAAIDTLTDAQAALEAAQADFDALESLEEAAEAAITDFEANDYNAPTVLGTAAFGRTGSDIFVVADEVATTISNFGRSGDDVLYIGSGYTLNTGDFAKDGDDAALEVFFVQQGNNVVVTIETEKFGSNSAEAEITITLTGVDADDLTFENGIISI